VCTYVLYFINNKGSWEEMVPCGGNGLMISGHEF